MRRPAPPPPGRAVSLSLGGAAVSRRTRAALRAAPRNPVAVPEILVTRLAIPGALGAGRKRDRGGCAHCGLGPDAPWARSHRRRRWAHSGRGWVTPLGRCGVIEEGCSVTSITVGSGSADSVPRELLPMPVAPSGPVEARLVQALHGGMQPDDIIWNFPTTVRPAGRKTGETALAESSVAAALLVKMVATAWTTAGAAMASTPGPVPMAMLASTVEVARMAALLSMADLGQMEAFVGMPWAAVLAEMSSMVPLVQAARMATMGMLAPMVVTALLDARVWMVQMLVMVSMSSWATLASTGYILVSCSVALRFFERSTEIDRCGRADAAAQMSPEERRQCCRADAANAAAQMSPEERRQCCRADVAGGTAPDAAR